MNCRPGDCALVIGGFMPNVGKVVHCIRLLPSGEGFATVQTSVGLRRIVDAADVWLLDSDLEYRDTDGECLRLPYARDCTLMPIRPNARAVERQREAVHT